MTADIARKNMLRTFSTALAEGTAALFVGAGISRPSGYVDWKTLLKDVAEDLSLDVDRESDLVALAQYHINQHSSRSKLNQLLVDEFTKKATLTDNHTLIASLPITTVWTTNYDDLLERAFENAEKRADIKRTEQNLAVTLPRRSVTIYKMHGDKTLPDEAVLTKEDYEAYELNRPLFSTALRGDLVEKTFLFLGFSFTDPNIDYILSRIRVLLGQNQREHFCLLKSLSTPKSRKKAAKDAFEYESAKLRHRIADLKRYSIQAIMLDDYGDITNILRDLAMRSHLRDAFVSGSATDFAPLGESRLNGLCRQLGKALISNGFNIVSGFGLGIGGSIIFGAMSELGENDEQRLHLRPFPQSAPPGRSLANFRTEYREKMISRSGSCIFVSGNRDDGGTIIDSPGVMEEFEICCRNGKFPIPIGVTGHAAEALWKKVMTSLDTYFPSGGVKGHFEVLGNPAKSNDELVDAVLKILARVSR
jgi:hypothetical protein